MFYYPLDCTLLEECLGASFVHFGPVKLFPLASLRWRLDLVQLMGQLHRFLWHETSQLFADYPSVRTAVLAQLPELPAAFRDEDQWAAVRQLASWNPDEPDEEWESIRVDWLAAKDSAAGIYELVPTVSRLLFTIACDSSETAKRVQHYQPPPDHQPVDKAWEFAIRMAHVTQATHFLHKLVEFYERKANDQPKVSVGSEV